MCKSNIHLNKLHVSSIALSIFPFRKFHKGAVLCLSIPEPNSLVTCGVDRRVREFDMRVPVSLVADHHEHTGPVLGLTCSKNYVYSGGEDKKLCVWDRRARSVLQTLRVS